MPTTKTITLYKYDELPESSQENARNWFREGNLDYEWHEYPFDEFTEDISKEGIDILTREQKHIGGYDNGAWNPHKETTVTESNIYFSGFSSQGDGASFEANVNIANWLKAHKLANRYRRYYNIAKKEGYRCAIRRGGQSYHEMTMHVYTDGTDYPEYTPKYDVLLERILEDCRQHAKSLYRQLETEYDYLQSDECVIEAIQANEYTFTIDGKREG